MLCMSDELCYLPMLIFYDGSFQVCKLPVYWKAPLFNLCRGMNKTVDLAGFKKTWSKY